MCVCIYKVFLYQSNRVAEIDDNERRLVKLQGVLNYICLNLYLKKMG